MSEQGWTQQQKQRLRALWNWFVCLWLLFVRWWVLTVPARHLSMYSLCLIAAGRRRSWLGWCGGWSTRGGRDAAAADDHQQRQQLLLGSPWLAQALCRRIRSEPSCSSLLEKVRKHLCSSNVADTQDVEIVDECVMDITTGVEKDQGWGRGDDDALAAEEMLRPGMSAVVAVLQAKATVSQLIATSYDSTRADHEALLEQLWTLLRPGIRRDGGRITAEWGEIGFQGKDPATDFRAMGVFSLHCLIWHIRRRPQEARNNLQRSKWDHSYYPYAVGGIHFAKTIQEWLGNGLLDDELAASAAARGSEVGGGDVAGGGQGAEMGTAFGTVMRVFDVAFSEFAAEWGANTYGIMDFNHVKASVVSDLERRLAAGNLLAEMQ